MGLSVLVVLTLTTGLVLSRNILENEFHALNKDMDGIIGETSPLIQPITSSIRRTSTSNSGPAANGKYETPLSSTLRLIEIAAKEMANFLNQVNVLMRSMIRSSDRVVAAAAG